MVHSKKSLWSVRSGFVVLVALLGVLWLPPHVDVVAVVLGSLGVGVITVGFESWLRRLSLNSVVLAAGGALVGCVGGLLLVINLGPSSQSPVSSLLRLLIPISGAYLGFVVGLSKQLPSTMGRFVNDSRSNETGSTTGFKILDTSVLIDGRIADVAEAGFLDGRLLIPQFVLHELQNIADSADSIRRNRGRRGLDVVRRLQKVSGLEVELVSEDFPALSEVDLKLIKLAKEFSGAKIVTNDFNLNKLAQVQEVRVLNINELANCLKPVVLPGEIMRVFILKEGKEHNQGVAYLDDGTMVVIDNARRLISKTVDITVTTVLQTTAGKMIFAKYDERHQTAEARNASPGTVSAASASAS